MSQLASGRMPPTAASMEVLTRRRCIELSNKLSSAEQTISGLKTEKAAIVERLEKSSVEHAEADALKKENVELKRANEELSQTLHNASFASTAYGPLKTSMSQASGLAGMDGEREQLAVMRDEILKQMHLINSNEKVMERMQEEYSANIEQHKAQASEKIVALEEKLNEAQQELDTCEQRITEQIDLNQTISDEREKYEQLAEEYKSKLEEYQSQLDEIKGHDHGEKEELQKKLDTMQKQVVQAADKYIFWKEQADRKTKDLSHMGRKLNAERAQRTSVTKLYRSQSIQCKALRNKTVKMEGEVQDLTRELAASRLEVKAIHDKKQAKLKSRVKRATGCKQQ